MVERLVCFNKIVGLEIKMEKFALALLILCLVSCGDEMPRTPIESCAQAMATVSQDAYDKECNALSSAEIITASKKAITINPGLQVNIDDQRVKEVAIPLEKQNTVQAEKLWTNQEAVTLANKTLDTIDQAQKDLEFALQTKDIMGFNEYVRRPINEVIDQWPSYSNSSAAVNPFRQCFMALSDFYGFADTYTPVKDDVRNRKFREMMLKNFEKSYRDCRADIKKSDMSLMDVNK